MALALAGLAGCAHTYVDGNGNTHVVGMVHVVMPKISGTEQVRAQALQVRSFGLSLLSSAERSSLTLGYNNDTLVLVHGSACVGIGSGVHVTPLDNTFVSKSLFNGEHER
jgi:hypothetical protein